MVMLHINLKVSQNFAADPPNPGVGFKRLKSHFSEYCHVAYQIIGNHKCSNMVANIKLTDTRPDPGDGVNRSKVNFLEHGHIAYQIKGNRKILLQTPTASPLTQGLG